MRKAKIVYNIGLSECNRVNMFGAPSDFLETLKCIRITVKHWTIRDGVSWIICCLRKTYIVRGDYIQSIRVGRCETVSILISLLLQSRYPPLILFS